jgi:hypothetical protein
LRDKKNLSQSREGAKASGSLTERTTISLRLGAFARRKKKKLVSPQFCGAGCKLEKAQSLRMTSLLLGIDFPNFSSFTYDHF